MSVTKVPAEQGWFDSFKEKIHIDQWAEKLNLSKNRLIEIGIYLGIGFLTGFLLRRFSKYVIVFVLFILGIVLLNQFGIINVMVNWSKVNEVFGIQTIQKVDGGLIVIFWEWTKANLLVVFSFSIGFLIGLKVG